MGGFWFWKEILRIDGRSISTSYLMMGIKILPDLNRLDIREEDRNYNYYCRIQEHEVREALKSFKKVDAAVTSQVISFKKVTHSSLTFLQHKLNKDP